MPERVRLWAGSLAFSVELMSGNHIYLNGAHDIPGGMGWLGRMGCTIARRPLVFVLLTIYRRSSDNGERLAKFRYGGGIFRPAELPAAGGCALRKNAALGLEVPVHLQATRVTDGFSASQLILMRQHVPSRSEAIGRYADDLVRAKIDCAPQLITPSLFSPFHYLAITRSRSPS